MKDKILIDPNMASLGYGLDYGYSIMERIKLKEKIGFGSFSAASNIMYQFKSLYYLFFLTEVLRIPMGTAGTILALGIVWDALNDPLVGYFAVNHRFHNGERVRPFALYSAVPWGVTIVLIYTNFHASKVVTIVIASLAFCLICSPVTNTANAAISAKCFIAFKI